jgi:sugar lactone lactonase YvrE
MRGQSNRWPVRRPEPATAPGMRRRWLAAGVVAAAMAMAVGPGMSAVLAAGAGGAPTLDEVSVFATAPAPGHPFGIAVDKDRRVYVSTSAGDFFAGHLNSDGERVFTYDQVGRLIATTIIPTAPNSDMGLFGLALDGNPGPEHNLYVADMNGRILRLNLGQHPAPPQLFSQTTISGGWMSSMWNDLAFDTAGNLYVPDDKPRIWRVSPDGSPSIWFTDPRLEGYFGFAGGPLGGRIDPTGQWLYFSITVSGDPAFPLAALIYRVRLVDHPASTDLELVHVFPFDPSQAPPQATGLAFAASGDLYVSLLGPNQIAVLDPSGNEIRRISSPLFHSPWGLAFVGTSLLVSNGDLEPADNPAAWKIFKVFVGEEGLPLNRPRTSTP